MSYKKLISIGDAHFRGDGAEWPKLYGYLGPIPKEYKSNFWLSRIKKGYPDELKSLHSEFYKAIKDPVVRSYNEIIDLRKKLSFPKLLAGKLGCAYENYALKTEDISEILPFFKTNCEDTNFKDTLIICGVPKAVKNLTYNQEGSKLSNITIKFIATNILLLKEFVENRGGHFMYMHTEDYPIELYDHKLNPYLMDILPFLIHQGDLASLLTQAYYWRKYDGRFYDAGTHKVIADILYKKLEI